jgi:transposase
MGEANGRQVQGQLFAEPQGSAPARAPRVGARRLRRPEREQVEWRETCLDELLPADHEARLVWAYVEGLDLSALEAEVQSVESGAGHPAADPRLLVALWLYSTLRGNGSARELARLCTAHSAWRWLCGGVSVNYHSLSDFRVAHAALLEELLTVSVASLLHVGAVQLERVAQDGMRVRAAAGAASFRRRETLERCLAQAEEQVALLKQEAEGDGARGTRRQQAARQRAAEERRSRVAEALAQLPAVAAKKKKKAEREQARASTTDPDARVMKMPDGGYRPAHNIQYATDTETGIIVGVEVVNAGSDMGQLAPMVEQITERCEQAPEVMLVDGGFAKLEDIETVSATTVVYCPVPKPRDKSRDPHQRLPGDSAAVGQWRERMGTAQAKEIYKERAASAELVNAQARNHGLYQLPVRGLPKARAVALWYALAHNLRRLIALGLVTVG